MWTVNQMKTGTCPCCKVCKNCPGFQKVLDRPDSGFILYRHTTHVEDINKKTGVIETTTDTIDDVFIIENTQGAALKKIDFAPEIDRNQISCPRCINILKHAESLFQNQEIGDSDVIGVCEHCRQKSQRGISCLKCDEVVEKFQLNKSQRKQTHAQRVKTWLSKVQQLITVALEEKNGKKAGSPIRRGHSDIDISQLFRKASKTDHEPEIEDLCLKNICGIQSALKGPVSERSYFPTKVAFYESDEKNPMYSTPEEGVAFLHSQSNATLTEDELEKDFIRKYGKSYKEKRSFEDPTARVRYMDEKYNELIPSAGDLHREGVRKEELIKEPDTRHEGGKRKDLVPTDSKHESDKKKGHLPDSDSGHEVEKKKEHIPTASKTREGDRDKDFIPVPKTRHEEEKKKADTPDQIKKHVTRDSQKEDFISVIGKRFEEEIEAKGLTLAPKKSHEPKKRKDLTTSSDTRLELEKKRGTISTGKDHKVGQKSKSGTKILFESPTHIKKYHSDESLIAGISKMKEDTQKHKTFKLYFPEKPETRKKKLKAGSGVSSAELIKDTVDKLKTKREEADRMKEERSKKLEEERLDKEKRAAEKLAAKLAKDAEKEQKLSAKGKESEMGAQDMLKKGQDLFNKNVDVYKKDHEAPKKDRDILKKEQEAAKKGETLQRDQDVSRKDRDTLKKEQETAKKGEAFQKDKDVSRKDRDALKKEQETPKKGEALQKDKDESRKDKDANKKKNEDDMTKEKMLKEKTGKDTDKKGNELEVDINKIKIEKSKGDELKVANVKAKEEKSSEEKTKDKKTRTEEKTNKDKEMTNKDKEMKPKEDKEVKSKEGTSNKQTLTDANKRDPEADKLLKQLEQEAKDREKQQQELKQQKEEEKRLKLAEQKAKETANQVAKTDKKSDTERMPAPTKRRSKAKILDLIKMKQRPKEIKKVADLTPLEIKIHKNHRSIKRRACDICNDSDLELDLQSLLMHKQEEQGRKGRFKEAVIGETIYKFKTQMPEPQVKEEINPILFQKQFALFGQDMNDSQVKLVTKPQIEAKPKPKGVDQDYGKGVVRYALSDRTFIEKGWTMLPTEKVVRKMNVYRMRPAHPEFDWFEHNKKKGMLEYDTGEKLAEFDDNGRGRWYYRNGKLALDYYDAEESNAQQRFVIYSSGEPDERGRTHPRTVLATFDYLGNGCVFDHAGKIRLKYNQTEGVVLDRTLGPVSHWKWHTLNDPPVLQQVMIDTQMAHKDPQILKLGGPADNKPRPDDEEMLAIEFDNFIKEKSAKLSQSFKPFQIKMKALKINEHFSLRVLDQATVYLLYRDGSTNIKINIGMILDHKEIVDTDTAEVGEVSNNVERLPARTDSLAELQRNVANAQRIDRSRSERERRLRRPEPCASVDRMTAAASRPLKVPLRTVDSTSTVGGTKLYCKCRKPTACNVYYDTSLI